MRHTKETAAVIEDHGYPLQSIIIEIMRKFKIKTLCHRSGFYKQAGHDIFEILLQLLMIPLFSLQSVKQFLGSEYSRLASMKKDTLYRFKNNERNPWRSLHMCIVKMFLHLAESVPADDEAVRALILDDTGDTRVGFKIEGISWVFDHVIRKTVLGFKHLILAYFDGKSTIPIDFSLHSEKKLTRKQAKGRYEKDVRKGSSGAKRRKELKTSKIDQGISMIKRAVKHGLKVDYVLCDSWFTSLGFIQAVRALRNGAVHIIAAVRKDNRKYGLENRLFNAKEIISWCKESGAASRCRSLKLLYYEMIVTYAGVGEVKLVICRYARQKDWRVFISTNTSLRAKRIMDIYSIRWNIEVMFKEEKELLQLGNCQSRDFDAQITNATITHILYIFLTYIKRSGPLKTTGEVFRSVVGDLFEKNACEKFWNLFCDLLTNVTDNIISEQQMVLSRFLHGFLFIALKQNLESSFLLNQFQCLLKDA